MMGETIITLTQALHMVALAPCVLAVIYLVSFSRRPMLVVVPVLYFLSLISGFLYSLFPLFLHYPQTSWINVMLVYGESFLPAVSYLLIFQFILNRVPPFPYWMILAVPGIGASLFVYGAVFTGEMCFTVDACVSSVYVKHLNNVVISSAIFMLLIVVIARVKSELAVNAVLLRHKYWLIISLVVFNIILLSLDLAFVSNVVTPSQYDFSQTMIKLGFIYLVLSSIFRVFSEAFDIKNLKTSYHKMPLAENEMEIAEKAIKLLEEKKVYRELEFNRASLADMLGIKEHSLSRIINLKFGKSFSELANYYRVREAKELLMGTDQPVTVISFDVGFSSITSFNRVFKEVTGKSPSDYREGGKKPVAGDNDNVDRVASKG